MESTVFRAAAFTLALIGIPSLVSSSQSSLMSSQHRASLFRTRSEVIIGNHRSWLCFYTWPTPPPYRTGPRPPQPKHRESTALGIFLGFPFFSLVESRGINRSWVLILERGVSNVTS